MMLDVNSKEIDLKKIEKKAYLFYHHDGLLDILVGFFILGSGMSMADLTVVPALLLTMCILNFWPAKRFISYPRMGYARFSPERRAKEKKKLAALVILCCVPLIVSIIIMKGFPSSGWAIWLKGHEALFGEVIVSALVGTGAILSGARRLYIYAVLTLMVFVTHYLLNVSPGLYFIPLGVAILISGAVVLIRFLRKYPKIAEEGFDGNH